MSETAATSPVGLMIEREEVLEICYWYQGEGFGDRFTPPAVLPFLQSAPERIAEIMASLVETGELRPDRDGFAFTAAGRRKAAQLFFETFTEFQQPSHGECTAGCCDGDEVCDDPRHHHGQGGHAGGSPA